MKNKKIGADEEKTFRVPGGPLIPLIAALAILWLLYNLSGKELISMAIFLAICAVVYVLMAVLGKKPL